MGACMRLESGNGILMALATVSFLATPLVAQAATHTYSHATVHHVAYHSALTHHYHGYRVSYYSPYRFSQNPGSLYHYSPYHYSAYRYGTRHYYGRGYRVAYYHGIQCVAFAKADSGIRLSGNAADWWYNAAGVYQRGDQPEVGAVLNFRANPRMRLGHVAVVSNVIDARTVEIDQANWGWGSGMHGGMVTRSTMVVDVSPHNDWTAVRVGLDHAGDYGSIYPTYGFIYARPDNGTEVASNTTAAAPADTLNAAPADLRHGASYDEVAEVPATSGIDTGATLGEDAPDRALQ